MDFESISLATRTHCHCAAEAAPATPSPVAGRGDAAAAREHELLRAEPHGFRIHVLGQSDTRPHRSGSRICPLPWRGGEARRQRGRGGGGRALACRAQWISNQCPSALGHSVDARPKARPLRPGHAQPNPARHDPHARPSARRDRSSTPKRIRTIRCSESYSCTRSPKPIVDINAAFFNSLRKIFLPCSFAEASSRRQKNGIAQSEVPHPTPAPTRRGRSTTSIRHRTIRSWQSFPRANSPRPIVDFNAE